MASEIELPVIDFTATDAPAHIDSACRDWGFFQLVGHGIPAGNLEQLLAVMTSFFALPSETKSGVRRSASNPWGFNDRELTKNRRDWKEIFDCGNAVVGPGDPFPKAEVPWPEQDTPFGSEFRRILERHFAEATNLASRLLDVIAHNLDADAEHLRAVFGPDHASYLRLNHYPICADPAPADSGWVPEHGELAISHHTDAGALTILVHDGNPGLQVHRGDAWYTVDLEPDALVINIGDVLQVWSNDVYPAPLHRVVASAQYERSSAPFFYNPAYAATYAPLPNMGTPRYREISWAEFRAGRAGGDYADLGEEIQISRYRV